MGTKQKTWDGDEAQAERNRHFIILTRMSQMKFTKYEIHTLLYFRLCKFERASGT